MRHRRTRPRTGPAARWPRRSAFLCRSVQRIWDAHKLQPHRLRTFKRSRDPEFATKLVDIVGLCVDPPEHAVVLSIDEKSQIQALDRTQPGLPLKPGRCATMTHDYKRHGTTTLFAALNLLDGTVIGRCMQRHRHEEFIRFLNDVERAVPAGKLIEAVVDNDATHKHPKVKAWLARHPRWTFHFTPTSGSWLNAVETFFSVLTRKRIRRGSFHSVVDLQAAIRRYLAEHNAEPKPFVWKASAAAILAKLDNLPAPSVKVRALAVSPWPHPAVIRTRLLGTVNIPKGCDKEGALRLGAPSLGGNARTVHVPRESWLAFNPPRLQILPLY